MGRWVNPNIDHFKLKQTLYTSGVVLEDVKQSTAILASLCEYWKRNRSVVRLLVSGI
jgi:hypothetical protein